MVDDKTFNLFKIGDPVELELIKTDGEIVNLRSIVYNITSDAKYSLAAPVIQGRSFPLDIGRHLTAYYSIENQGIFSFQCLVVSRNTEDNLPAVQVLRTSEIRKSQRRMFYRVAFFSNIELKVPKKEDTNMSELQKRRLEQMKQKYADRKDIIIDTDEEDYDIIKLEARDLSGGGFRSISRKKIDEESIVEGYIELEGMKISFKAKVMRSILNTLPYEHYEIGCMFIEMDEVYRAKIINYVFRKQRSLLSK